MKRKNRVGRNDPCPCGSVNAKTGEPIKYKKCCLIKPVQQPSSLEITQMKDELNIQSEARRKVLRQYGIFIDFPSPVNHQGRSLWALGSRLYYYPQENITFHEALFFVLSQELGKNWIENQESLPLEQRHFILKCHHEYLQYRKVNKVEKNQVGENTWSASPDGLTKSLLSLAFDVSCIIHAHGKLPEKILARLKLPDSNYQGARYEIAVAAIFARIGCKFEFLDESLQNLAQTPGHCEFFAMDKETKSKVAVEAKSKVRKGILHEPGQAQGFQLWNNVTRPYRAALSQNPDNIPFFVFVDVNSPPTPAISIFYKPWAKDILESRKRNPLNKPDKPDPCTGIVYTNYSYHYQTGQEAMANEALAVFPEYPKHTVSEQFIEKLKLAISHYSYVPNINYDGTISN